MKAIVEFNFYDGWGSSHSELYETELRRQKDGQLVPVPPNPMRGWIKDRWKLIRVSEDNGETTMFVGSPARPTRAATEKGGNCGEKETRQEGIKKQKHLVVQSKAKEKQL